MDDDVVLRSLGADLERDDPRLAALLSGKGRPRLHRSHAWAWLLLPLLGGLLLLPLTVAVGILVILLAVAGPLVGCWAALGSGEPGLPHAG